MSLAAALRNAAKEERIRILVIIADIEAERGAAEAGCLIRSAVLKDLIINGPPEDPCS